MKIGFIGFGSMGRAIAEGLIARNVCTPEDIYACAGHFDKLQETADKLGIHAERTAADVVAKSDWVVPAVVPAILEDVLGPGAACAAGQDRRLHRQRMGFRPLRSLPRARHAPHQHDSEYPHRHRRGRSCVRVDTQSDRGGVCAV